MSVTATTAGHISSSFRSNTMLGDSATATTSNSSPTLSEASLGSLSSSSHRKSHVPLRVGSISFLEYKNMRFVICDSPCDKNLPGYIKEFKRFGVSDVVRVCAPSYSDLELRREGIEVHDWPFEDGSVPPGPVIARWMSLVKDRFGSPLSNRSSTSSRLSGSSEEGSVDSRSVSPAIAVHCVAGLGRAPVLVAIALIENGMDKLDAIEFIRQKRRGAFNLKQIQFIDSYKKMSTKATFKSKFSKIFRLRSSA